MRTLRRKREATYLQILNLQEKEMQQKYWKEAANSNIKVNIIKKQHKTVSFNIF
jgi:uncharacterized protein YueI